MHLTTLIPEVQLTILTYLRAYDLASLQQTCNFFNSREQIESVIRHTATHVFPPELTEGFDSPIVGGEVSTAHGRCLSYEHLRNMEILVVTRLLSSPEPPLRDRENSFYVSKAWCKAALNWLEIQRERHVPSVRSPRKNKGKKEKKAQRIRSRRISEASPPWANVNHDISCEHENLRRCSSKSARARRRTMDKQAWKVLRKLYPESNQLCSLQDECLQCKMEEETLKKNHLDQKHKEKEERKKPLSDPKVRAFYTRNKGLPNDCILPPTSKNCQKCPLITGVYHALPRSWCHQWRKYLRCGGDMPHAPDSGTLLCDAHRLPLVPPHLEDFLCGREDTLLGNNGTGNEGSVEVIPFAVTEHTPIRDIEVEQSMLAAGLSAEEVERLSIQENRYYEHRYFEHCAQMQSDLPSNRNPAKLKNLDQENCVVVELLSDEEFTALQTHFPGCMIHSGFSMTFGVMDGGEIVWSTLPCRECDAGHPGADVIVRNRNRSSKKKW